MYFANQSRGPNIVGEQQSAMYGAAVCILADILALFVLRQAQLCCEVTLGGDLVH